MPDIFVCGGAQCSGGGQHEWDGPARQFVSGCILCLGEPTPEGQDPCRRCKGDPDWSYVSGESATCSKCGLDAMSYDMMTAL